MTGFTNMLIVYAGMAVLAATLFVLWKIDGVIQRVRGVEKDANGQRPGGPFLLIAGGAVLLAVFVWMVLGGGGGGWEPIRR